MALFHVDHSRCRKDGICAKLCPVRIIDGTLGEFPTVSEDNESKCFACGQCMAFCPTAACTAPGLVGQEAKAIQRDLLPQAEQVEELLVSCRSVRNYRDRPVPRELLERLLDATRFAPTARNTQNLRWVVLSTREQTEKLVGRMLDWMRDLPRTDPGLAKLLHPQEFLKAWEDGVDLIARGAPNLLVVIAPETDWGHSDAAIALTYVDVLAHAHGLGCCWGGYFCRAFAHPAAGAVRDFVGLAEGEKVYGALMLGYPRFTAVAKPPRKALRANWM